VKIHSKDDTRVNEMIRPVAWPAGHRSALAVVVDLDPNPQSGPPLSPLNDAVGTERVLTMLADLDIIPTVVIEPEPPYAVPVPADIAGVDGAVRLRSDHVDTPTARKALEERGGGELHGVVLTGTVPPGSFDDGSLWVMDGSASPFPQRSRNGNVVIPYTAWWHDAAWFDAARPSPPSAMLEAWSVSLSSVRTRGELMVVMLSSAVAGLPGTVETAQRFLDDAVGAGDVWITNATAVASHVSSAQHDSGEHP
jgi:hypothetical protein